MDLKHTTIIQATDISVAQKQFSAAMNDNNALIVVVLGNNNLSTNAVQLADQRAAAVVAGFIRKVLWIQNFEVLASEIKKIAAGYEDISNKDLTKVVAFSISLSRKVADIIYSQDEIDFARIDLAFIQAGEL